MFRALRWLIIALLVLMVSVLALARFAPTLFTPLFESLAQRAGYTVSYEEVSVSYFPLKANLGGLTVAASDSTEPFFAASTVDVSLALMDWLDDDAWLGGELAGVQVFLDRLPVADSTAADSESSQLDLTPLTQLNRLVFSDISVFEDADLPPILALGGSLNPSDVAANNALDFSIAGEVLNLAVDVTGRLEQGAVPRVVLAAKSLDLTPVLRGEEPSADSEEPSAGKEPSADKEPSAVKEPPVDTGDGPATDLRQLTGASLALAVTEASESAVRVDAIVTLPALIIEVGIDELLGVRELVPLATADILPLDLVVDLDGGVDRLAYELNNASWGPNRISGSGSFDFSTLNLVSRLKADVLHVPQGRSAPDEVEPDSVASEPGRLLSEAPIDWSWLASSSVDVQLSILKLHIVEAIFSEVEVAVAGGQGALTVQPLKGKFGNGGFDGSLTLRQQEQGVVLTSAFDLDGVDLQAFGFVPEEELTGGALIARIALAGEGVSVADLASSLDGSILVTVQDAIVQNDTFELIGSDLLMETLNKLNPFAKTDPTTQLDCALVQFEVAEGVLKANNSLVVETEKMEIIGNGTVDLSDETLSIGFSPSSRAGVGVNVGSLVKFLKLGGTLSDPRPTADAAGLLKSGAAVGAAVSTGGVSILAEGVFKRLANAGSACKRALAGEPILAPEEQPDAVGQSSSG